MNDKNYTERQVVGEELMQEGTDWLHHKDGNEFRINIWSGRPASTLAPDWTCFRRTPIEPAPVEPSPGDGYRWLEMGEVIIKGDDHKHYCGAWMPSYCIGGRLSRGDIQRYRRKIETPTQPIEPTDDPVHLPSHYRWHPSGVECKTIAQAFQWNIGNAIAYLWRHGRKEGVSAIQDLEKAVVHIQQEIAMLKAAQMEEGK